MNCQEFWDSVPDVARDPDTRHRAHLGSCASCAAIVEKQRSVAQGLKRLSAECRNTEAPVRVEASLRAAYRRQSGMPPVYSGPRWLYAATWISAAAALAVLALFLVRGRQPQPLPPVPARGTELLAQVSFGEVGGEESAYVNDGFIPLPNAERIAANEDVNLVRVEVPRSAMIALGIDVAGAQTAEPVQAEVVLGSDGVARAVRFLDE